MLHPLFSPSLRDPDAHPTRKQGFLGIKPVTKPELKQKLKKYGEVFGFGDR